MKRALYLLPLILWSTAWAQEEPPAPQAASTAQEVDIKSMKRDAQCGQVLVTCIIGGQPMRMMLDTGATHSVLHTASASKLTQARWIDTSQMQFRGNAKQQPKIVVSSLQVAESDLPEQPFLVLNLEAVIQSLAEPLDGILGMDVLGGLPFTFDQRQERYYWGLPSSGQAEQLFGVPDTYGRLIVHARTQGKTLHMLLDTGSSITRVHEGEWVPGSAGTISAQVGDVNTATHLQIAKGKPAAIEVARGVVLKDVAPVFGQDNQPAILGMDAFKNQVLIHLPLEDYPYGVFLIQK